MTNRIAMIVCVAMLSGCSPQCRDIAPYIESVNACIERPGCTVSDDQMRLYRQWIRDYQGCER